MPKEVALLEARRIGRLHRDATNWLLRDISLAIHAGDRIALTGPTGAGKSVLLRALALLDAVQEGEIAWQGECVAADLVPTYRAQSVYLMQRPQLFEGTAEDNLQLPFSLAAHRHRKYSKEAAVEHLKLLGRNEQFLTRESATMSGGEAQIAAILRAIQLAPKLLLLDEPTASLDEDAARRLEQFIVEWVSEPNSQRAFVWVTHDLSQAERIANRRLQLRNGVLDELEAHA